METKSHAPFILLLSITKFSPTLQLSRSLSDPQHLITNYIQDEVGVRLRGEKNLSPMRGIEFIWPTV